MEKNIDALTVACFFLGLDEKKEIFTTNLIERNGRQFYEGNAKLNKFLHLAQNLYIAKYGEVLFEDNIYAYDNGGVVPSIQVNYVQLLRSHATIETKAMPQYIEDYLRKFFKAFKNASVDELIELSHEDEAWQEKSCYYKKEDQVMDTKAKVELYKAQYADMVVILDRMAS